MILPIVHKLWDKGVDIGASVIASVFIGSIGLLFWQFKLWLDLQADAAKQKQQHRLKQELERQDEREKEMARRAALPDRREQFAAIAEKTLDRSAQGDIWDQVCIWLHSERLLEIPDNLEAYSGLSNWSYALRDPSPETPQANAVPMARTIRSIQLPSADLS